MKMDVISQAKGSALMEVGNTKIICGVYGPKDLQRGADFKLTGQVMNFFFFSTYPILICIFFL